LNFLKQFRLDQHIKDIYIILFI